MCPLPKAVTGYNDAVCKGRENCELEPSVHSFQIAEKSPGNLGSDCFTCYLMSQGRRLKIFSRSLRDSKVSSPKRNHQLVFQGQRMEALKARITKCIAIV